MIERSKVDELLMELEDITCRRGYQYGDAIAAVQRWAEREMQQAQPQRPVPANQYVRNPVWPGDDASVEAHLGYWVMKAEYWRRNYDLLHKSTSGDEPPPPSPQQGIDTQSVDVKKMCSRCAGEDSNCYICKDWKSVAPPEPKPAQDSTEQPSVPTYSFDGEGIYQMFGMTGQYVRTDDYRDLREAVQMAKAERDRWYSVAQSAPPPANPNAGIKCTHCNGSGKQQQVYDEQSGWSDERACDTCGGSGKITTVEQYLKTLPANWHEDSSLETWFPITAEELNRLKEQSAAKTGDSQPTDPPFTVDRYGSFASCVIAERNWLLKEVARLTAKPVDDEFLLDVLRCAEESLLQHNGNSQVISKIRQAMSLATRIRRSELSAAKTDEGQNSTLIDAARSFHETYCPSCPDELCSLGRALREVSNPSRLEFFAVVTNIDGKYGPCMEASGLHRSDMERHAKLFNGEARIARVIVEAPPEQ